MTENYKSVGDRWREVITPKPSIIGNRFSILDLFGLTAAIAIVLSVIASIHMIAALFLIPVLGAFFSYRFTHHVSALFAGFAAGMLVLFFAFVAVWPVLVIAKLEPFDVLPAFATMVISVLILLASMVAGHVGAKVHYH